MVLIHKRIPQLLPCDNGLVYVKKLYELKYDTCFSALDSLFRKNNVEITSKEQIAELANYIDGYPPAIYYAVNECIMYGIDMVCSDKSNLVDFKSGIFSKYLNSLKLNDLDNTIIQYLFNLGGLSVEILCLLIANSKNEIISSLKKCMNYCVISSVKDGLYSIAAPLNIAISRKYSLFTKKEMADIAHIMIEKFNNEETEGKSIQFINVMISAILSSDLDEEIKSYKVYILPSKLIKLAHNFNQKREWEVAEKYTRWALDLKPELIEAKLLLFKLLVRKETKFNHYADILFG